MKPKPYKPWTTQYNPAEWRLKRRLLRIFVSPLVSPLLGRIEKVEGLENIPPSGRLLGIYNHIAFIDPLAILATSPRDFVPMMKAEALDYPLIGHIPRWWGTIPIWRGKVDMTAMRQSLAVLEADEALLIAPEGTRNQAMQRGKLGTAYLAARTQAPVLPIAVEGSANFPTYPLSPRWRQGGIVLRFGKPFRFTITERNPSRQLLQKMTDEAMYVLASLLPPHRRGYYADTDKATQDTIEWL